jgi:hypothetical protein
MLTIATSTPSTDVPDIRPMQVAGFDVDFGMKDPVHRMYS